MTYHYFYSKPSSCMLVRRSSLFMFMIPSSLTDDRLLHSATDSVGGGRGPPLVTVCDHTNDCQGVPCAHLHNLLRFGSSQSDLMRLGFTLPLPLAFTLTPQFPLLRNAT